jgi:hypothetical protein
LFVSRCKHRKGVEKTLRQPANAHPFTSSPTVGRQRWRSIPDASFPQKGLPKKV